MLISGVLPIMSLYRLPHGQYAYSGHVINLPQDVASFANTLPRLPSQLDVIVVRKEGRLLCEEVCSALCTSMVAG